MYPQIVYQGDSRILGFMGLGALDQEKAIVEMAKRVQVPGGGNAVEHVKKALTDMGNKVRHAFSTSHSKGYRWVMSNLHLLSPELQAKVLSGAAKVSQASLFHIKSISGLKSIELFGTGTSKIEDFICNIEGGKLESNTAFLVTSVRVMYGVKTNSVDGVETVDFSDTALPKVIRAGWFKKLKAGNAPLFGKKYPLENFANKGEWNKTEGLRLGEVELAQYLLIQEKDIIAAELAWIDAAATDSVIKIMLNGFSIGVDTE